MDLVRFGLVVRALRRRRSWRQLDLALAAGVSQDTVSLIERGHGDRLAHGTLVRVGAALDTRVTLELRWRGGELERLLDQDHSSLVAATARLLQGAGWEHRVEVTYAIYGQNGSIDVMAWHAPSRSLLVLEIETEVTSGEATVRKLDEKARLATGIALDRFGWAAATVSRLLVVEDSSTARRRVAVGGELFGVSFPSRGVAVRHWLRAPAGSMSGLAFLPPTNRQRAMSRRGGRHRVRRGSAAPGSGKTSVAAPSPLATGGTPAVTVLSNRAYDAAGS